MTNFEPIISGQGFDGIAAQRQFWGSQNLRTEEANLARQAQAIAQQNAYAMAVSQAQRQDAGDVYRIQQSNASRAMDQANRAADVRRAEYEFGVRSNLRGKEIEADDRRNKSALAESAAQERKALEAISRSAKFMVPDINEAGSKLAKAQEAYDKSQAAFEKLKTDLQSRIPAGQVVYDPAKNMFVPSNPKIGILPAVDPIVQSANSELSKALAGIDSIVQMHQSSERELNNLRTEAQRRGLQVGRRGDKWVVYEANQDRQFDPSASLAPVATPAQTSTATLGFPRPAGGQMAPVQAPVAPQSAPEIIPLPSSKSMLRTGVVYDTKNGPAIWDGQKFSTIADERYGP